ncbi:hypothetical protein EYZ11_009082 [Aspergillus tanneri]|uniref:Spindle pole body component n=1 Tax=Aspergillus tanneri TaxID=1220188 RepID=A0A4S3J960_9EURO|nr:hypothetical protein EYZ11_009082 [Aspergillus tanneri]
MAVTATFFVANQLEGLQEKFQVLSKDELADALRSRLIELNQHRCSWFPEILSLLLQLADRPAQLSKLGRIEQRKQVQTKPITWTDLDASGSAYCDEDIWESVDFGAESSDDDLESVSSDGYLLQPPRRTSLAPEEDYVMPDDVFSSLEDENLIVSIKNAQFWRDENNNVGQHEKFSSRVITELQVVREAIFMLQGLPTSLFWRLDDGVEVDQRYTLAQLSSATLLSLLRTLSSIGSKLDGLRRFTKAPQTIPHMQAFVLGIEDCLSEFDKFLSDVQSQYLSRNATVAISILQLSEEARRESRLPLLLADLVSKINPDDNPVRCLDLLYDFICMAQSTGADGDFEFLARLFFSCFETYARPIRLWMETGRLENSTGGAFFILDRGNDNDLRTLWHEWYSLDDMPRLWQAPKFIQPLARKIFITGKSMVFLRHLNVSVDWPNPRKTSLPFGDLFPRDSESAFCLPFSALLESAFGKMVEGHHTFTSTLLRQELNQQCGLSVSLEALEHIYLCKNMSVAMPIDNKVFELIDQGRGAWNDRFLLTELAQSAFSILPVVDPSRLIVRSNQEHKLNGNCRSVKMLQAISFDYILPWPVANIITKDAIVCYRRISTLLMQIRRAKYAIQKQRLRHFGESDGISDGKANALGYAIRHNMLWFLNTLYSHLTGFVISTAIDSLRRALDESSDVDAMIAAHRSHMASLEDQCLLSKNLHPLHQATITLLDLCVSFADLHDTRQRGPQAEQRRFSRYHDNKSHSDDEDDDDENDDDYDDENENDPGLGRDSVATSLHGPQYTQRLDDIKNQFARIIAFMAAGLRGIGRVNGQVSWEMLAEKLEWRKERLAYMAPGGLTYSSELDDDHAIMC